MLKVGKVSLVIVVGLILSLTLLVSGAFAQSTGHSDTRQIARTTVVKRVFLGASIAMQNADGEPASYQQAVFICTGDCLARHDCTFDKCGQGHNYDSGNCSQARYCIFGSCGQEHNCIFGDCSRYRHCDDWWCSRW
jgi:hypothetical protein